MGQIRQPHSPVEAASQLGVSLDALAAVVAYLRAETEDIEVEPAIRELLASVTSEVLGTSGPLNSVEQQAIVGMVRALLYQADDLVTHPGRAGSWDDTDEMLMQSLGQASAGIVGAFHIAAAKDSSLYETLHRPNAVFIDVGTGSGWLAIAVAETFRTLRVFGIDLLPAALDLARRNVSSLGLSDRVELRLLDAANLEPDCADILWLPMPFLPFKLIDGILEGATRALRPGGWLLAGTFSGPGTSLDERLMTIRTLRSGGHPWTADELCARLRELGLTTVREVERDWPLPVRLYTARKP